MIKVAIVITHPIQYYAPVFKLLTKRARLSVKVFYTWGSGVLDNKLDPGFGKVIDWDIPLLEGYEYLFVNNIAKKQGSHHFAGIDNPSLIYDIKAWKPDALLVFGWSFKSHLRCLRYFHGKIPVYFRGDSNLLDRSSSLKQLLRTIFLTWVYKHVDIALYVGSANKQYYLHHGLKEKQLHFAPHAIESVRFSDSSGSYQVLASKWREDLGIEDSDTVFLFAGKLESKKNPLLLLEAFLQLSAKDAHLIFVGNGVLEATLKQMAASKSNIHFLNFQNQSMMPIVYRLADVFCLPSKGPGETWGLAVNEAMACGKPVLVSDKVGCASDLVSNKTGYIFKSNDLNTLIHLLWAIITNGKENVKSMGITAQEAVGKWDIEEQCVAIEDIICKRLTVV